MINDIDMKFDTARNGNCPKCRRDVHHSLIQHIRHCQSNIFVEVCSACKKDFIRLNDEFFKEVILWNT